MTAIPIGAGTAGFRAARRPIRPLTRTWAPPAGKPPAHPEKRSAHGCVTGSVATLITDFFGTMRVTVAVDSKAFTDGLHQHVFTDTRDLMDEAFWARIYAGFHFYHSLQAGAATRPVGSRPRWFETTSAN